MKRLLTVENLIMLTAIAIAVVIGSIVISKIPHDGFEICRQAFGPNWYPVHNVEGASCRHMNGTTRAIDWSGIA